MEMAAKGGRKTSPSFFGREEDSNPPGLGPGDTRGRTEVPDQIKLPVAQITERRASNSGAAGVSPAGETSFDSIVG